MLPYRDSMLTRIVLIIFFLLVLGYAYFEARGFLLGPSISIAGSVSTVHDPFVHITGTAQRISSLSMNGQPIPVTESGAFDQPYVLAPGVNRIVFDAKDTYGRTSRQVVEIVYEPPSAAAIIASTTGATTTPTSTLPIAP